MTQIQINALKDLQSMLKKNQFGGNNFSVNLQVLKESKLFLNTAEGEKIEVHFMGYRSQ